MRPTRYTAERNANSDRLHERLERTRQVRRQLEIALRDAAPLAQIQQLQQEFDELSNPGLPGRETQDIIENQE